MKPWHIILATTATVGIGYFIYSISQSTTSTTSIPSNTISKTKNNSKKISSYNHKQQHRDNSDSNKKESTNSGGDDDTPSMSSSQPKDILHDDVCSICCEDVSLMDLETYFRCTQCGEVMHMKCTLEWVRTKSLSYETRHSCPMCQAPHVDFGSKKQIEWLQKWSQRNRSWAQFQLSILYSQGCGVNKDLTRAFELCKLAADQGHHHAQVNLGDSYLKGRGVIQSDELAFKYLKLSADQGCAVHNMI